MIPHKCQLKHRLFTVLFAYGRVLLARMILVAGADGPGAKGYVQKRWCTMVEGGGWCVDASGDARKALT